MDLYVILAGVCAFFVMEAGMIFWILWGMYKDVEIPEGPR